jgi:hypothetical protein
MAIAPREEGAHSSGSFEDQAIRQVNALNYINAEIGRAIGGKEPRQAIDTIISELKGHVDELGKLRSRLKNFEVQLAIPKLQDAYRNLQKSPTEEGLASFARESYQIGALLSVPGCNVATHIEEMKVATHSLIKAVKASDQATASTQMNLIQILMGNLSTIHSDHQFSEPLRLLGQNLLILESRFPHPTHEDVTEWHKALHEFPPIT